MLKPHIHVIVSVIRYFLADEEFSTAGERAYSVVSC
jgi:hypothetical protein